MKRPESVLVLVINSSGQVLQLRRRSPEGFWQSVTGSLEENETPDQAACRELAEETGIRARPQATGRVNRYPIHPAWRHKFASHITHNLEHVYNVQLEGDVAVRIDPAEHLEHAWRTPQQALEFASSTTDRQAISRYFDQFSGSRTGQQ